MNILLINHYASSPIMGMEYRPYYLAQEWINNGHNVTILCADFSHLRTNNPKFEKDFHKENTDGINYVWVKTSKYKGNGFSRIKNIFQFVFKTFFNAKKITKKYKPDVVIASSTYPSDNYVAKKIAKLSSAKYIFEVHDLWPLSPMELGNMSKYHPFIMLMQHGENFAYKHADAVVSMLPKTKEHMQQHGLDLKKWNYIPNGVVIEDWSKNIEIPDKYKQKFENLKNENKTIIGYAGGHALSNSLNTMIEAARLLKNNDNYAFVLVGNGIEKEKLVLQAKNLQNVFFLDAVKKDEVPSLLSYFDYGIIGSIDSSLYRFGVSPNKLFDYMMASIPVIQHIKAGNDIIKEAQAGISIESNNPPAIVDAIIKLSNMPKDKLEKLGKNGQDFVLKNHDYKILSKKFIQVIENIN